MSKFLTQITIDKGLVTGLAFSFIQPTDLPIVPGLAPGGYTNPNLVIDQFGRITAAASGSSGGGTITLTGNVTGSGTTSIATTIAAGVVTNAMLAGSIAAANLVGTDIATVGTITVGVWQGTAIAATFLPSLDAITIAANNVNLNSNKLINVTDPTNPQDAATKNYVDTQIQGLANKAECQAATVTALAASTYANASSGVGATLTLNVAAVLVLDGYTPFLGDRILIKNQANATENGIYSITRLGTVLITAILTRTLDFDQATDGINGAFVFIQNGTVNAGTGWLCNTFGTITFGHGGTNINWVQDTGSGTYTGTAPIAVSASNVISLGAFTGLSAADVGLADAVAEYNAAGAVNSTVSVDRVGGFLNPQMSDFRLTALSGTAAPTTDQTGATSVYLTPKGNVGGTVAGSARIAVYDGSRHREYLSGELSLSVSSLVPGTYDVFVYDNSGTLTLETLTWTAVATGAITAATNATPIVITSAAHGLSNDQLVFISGVLVNTAANGTFRVAAVTTNTFSLTTLAGANVAGNGNYTSGGNWWRIDQNTARATAIDLQDGVWYKHGALTRRYLGTIRIVATGLLNDAAAQRCVWNAANRVARHFWAGETATNWSYTTNTYRPSNNNLTIGRTRVQTVIGMSEEAIDVNVLSPWFNSSNPFAASGIGLNSTTVTSALSYGGSTQGGTANAKYLGYPGIGALDIQQLESSNATGTTNWYGVVTGTSLQQNGLFGTIWA